MSQYRPLSEIPRPLKGLKIGCVCYLLVLFSATRCDFLTVPERDAYRDIKTHLLSHPYAVNKIPPKVNSTECIDIEIGFSPQQILFVNEVEMTVTVAASLYVKWHEPAFAWDPSNTSIYAINVATKDVWSPILINPLTINTDDAIIQMPPTLSVHHSGEMRTIQKVTITVSCHFDMEWYPFDEQRCSFPILPYNSEVANINTIPSQEPEISIEAGDEDSKGDWTWESVTHRMIIAAVEMNENVKKNFTYVSSEVVMKRRSITFYLTNIIFPVGATAILTLGVFLIPAASGEKISYLISIFISTTVFLSSLSNTMSKGQGTICRFNAFIVAITVKIILATAASIFVLHRYQQEQEQEDVKDKEVAPLPLAKIKNDHDVSSEHHRRKLSGVGEEINSPLPKDCLSSPKLNKSESPTSADNHVAVKRRQKTTLSGVSKYWRIGYRLNSSELDRMFFVIFTVVSVISYATIKHVRLS